MRKYVDPGDQTGRSKPKPAGELDMFDAFARNTDPATSHAAAAKVNVTKREAQVLDALRSLGSATSTEIAVAAGVDKWSISPRMKPLETKGAVERTDERRDGQIVWRLR